MWNCHVLKNENVIFSNLSGGSYRFEVLSSNNDGIWQQTPTSLTIEIAFPWYRTNLAYSFYLLFVSFIAFLGYREICNRKALKRKILDEKFGYTADNVFNQVLDYLKDYK